MLKTVVLIAKPGGPTTGVGRYVAALHQGLQGQAVTFIRLAPTIPPLPTACYNWLQGLNLDVRTFLTNYPVWAAYPPADLYHITSQNLASLLLFRRPPGRIVITVHDIIPYIVRQNPQLSVYRTWADRFFDRLAMLGLAQADLLLADSTYTKQSLIDQLGLNPTKIKVVFIGIDHTRFCPQAVPASFRERYGLPAGRPYLLFVGSEDPRKNLGTLLEAFALLLPRFPNAILIKAGAVHFREQAAKLRHQAQALGITANVIFLEQLPDEDIPILYNLADLLVIPSLLEGFGLPALEAMACGTPVIAANASSLPEIVGEAGILFDPQKPTELAAALEQLLADPEKQRTLSQAGLARAQTFTLAQQANQTWAAYTEVFGIESLETNPV